MSSPTPLTTNALQHLRHPLQVATQVAESLRTTLPSNPSISDLPTVVWYNKRYVVEEQMARKGGRGRKSWIKDHGFFLVELSSTGPANTYWCCRRCDDKGRPEFYSAAASSSAADHLRRCHQITQWGPSSDDSSTEETLHGSSDPSPSPKRRKVSSIPKFKVATVRDLCLSIIITNDLPFYHFQDNYVQQLLRLHDPSLVDQIPWGKTSMMDHLPILFAKGQTYVKAELHRALTKIHIGFDLWTSPNNYAYLSITAHFINNLGQQQSRLIAFNHMSGDHSGLNLSNNIFETLKQWEITSNVGVVVCDNASNNDTCISFLYKRLYPSMTQSDCQARRMRCYGHILNLVARALLFGADREVFEAESHFYQSINHEEEDLRLWRKTGPIGKLRNIVKFIRASPQRSERFRKVSHEVDAGSDFELFTQSSRETQLLSNNETRWNSTYLMINRALQKKAEIETYVNWVQGEDDAARKIPDDDLLSPEDWKVLAEVSAILEPFYLQTKRTEGWGKGDGHGRLWEVMTGMEYLLEHLEEWKTLYNFVIHPVVPPTREVSPEIDLTSEEDSQPPQTRSRHPVRPAVNSQHQPYRASFLPQHVREDWRQRTTRFRGLSPTYQEHLRTSVELAWQKLSSYYTKLEESPLFPASVILHPSLGISYLEAVWDEGVQLEWVRDAKKGLRDYFDRWYRLEEAPDDTMVTLEITLPPHEDSHFRQWVQSRRSREAPRRQDELETYLRQPPQPTDDPVKWWRGHQSTYPILSKLALDVFSIPAMAADCERAFSTAKLTLTSQRHSIQPQTMGQLQLTKNWLKGKILPVGGEVELGVPGS
ncbi:transposase-like protein [Colletotrichum musicola]|uniref:Transposase-like protein n=2 Tax=Colletotrichum orchidearum species complex TaxID=2707337 RepID=A0A8H6IRT1_9PEZI|nr:transposase-like protein [Colletotrichum sojae]KAF6793075.1 transposase-like protein [Colletotrichum musicola]